MALLQMSYLSKALFRTVPVQVILPADMISMDGLEYRMKEGEKFKTLYLLHGLIGNYTDWVTNTRIQRWAEEKNLAVVMPSGDNAFYVDSDRPNNNYGVFVGEELVDVTRRMFPLSGRREDTFIAGLSMGGFGAVRNGLRYSETFSRVAALSPALHIFENDDPDPVRYTAFGDLKEAKKTDKNPRVALENLIREGRTMPGFYISCGLDDDLLPYSRIYRDLLREKGADVVYTEEEGAHEWDFWDRHIKRVLEWLPLGAGDAGLGSGNVKIEKDNG